MKKTQKQEKQKKVTFTADEKALLEVLGTVPVSRHRLEQMTGKPDTINRKNIHNLRLKGVPIAATSTGYGYCIPDLGTPEGRAQLRACWLEMMGRAHKLVAVADALKNASPEVFVDE